MIITKEEFKLLSNNAKMGVIRKMDYRDDRYEIVELLTSVGIETLDTNLLGELGRTYNNIKEYEKALAVFEMIPEEQRDAKWYYHCGFSYSRLAKNLKCDFETQAKKALDMFDKAVQLAGEDDKIGDTCTDLVFYSKLKEFLEKNMEKYLYIAEKYLEYVKKKCKKKKIEIYKKITVEDIDGDYDGLGCITVK